MTGQRPVMPQDGAIRRGGAVKRADPPLYDVARALGDLDRYRATADCDPVAAKCVTVAADLPRHMARHFPDDESRRTAGCALVIVAASLGALRDLPIDVVCNIAGLAGHQLYRAEQVQR